MKMLKAARPIAALATLSLAACSSAEERQRELLMDRLEARAQLPPGSLAIGRYARYYAADPLGRITAVYITYVGPDRDHDLPLGRRKWLDDHRRLPNVSGGGCRVVHLLFDRATRELEQAACNGTGRAADPR